MKRLLLRSLLLVLLCAAAAFAGLACDSATPTAPAGTILTLSATPTQISLNGRATLTVIGRRPDGNPLNEGTEIFFTTDLGSVNPVVVAVDENGVAQSNLRGDGRAGTANVSARVSTSGGGGGEEGGGGTGSASTSVRIGSTAGAISLQATPTSVPEDFTEPVRQIQLLALLRDDQGQPLPDVPVNFGTEVGSLESGGSFIETNSAGEARDVLSVTEGDINTVSGDSFTVTVEAGSGGGGEGGGLRTDEVTISILRKPDAFFTSTTNGLQAIFEDLSTGNPTSWRWEFGDGQTSAAQNPTHTYSTAGTYTVTLTATNAAGSATFSRSVTVPSV
jgi:hypothetical protein